MRVIKKVLLLFILTAVIMSFTACSKKDDSEVEEINTKFNTNTNVSYSAGDDNNWSYGNQRKEFPQNETCYVRIGSTVIAEGSKGVGTEIKVTYKFTGAKNCKIELSDGIANKENTTDPDVVIYTRNIEAKKKNKATENLLIFRYLPDDQASSVTLEITYDDHVSEQYDVRNTIYFSKSSDTTDNNDNSGTVANSDEPNSNNDSINIDKSRDYFLGSWEKQGFNGTYTIVETDDPKEYELICKYDDGESVLKCHLLLPGEEEYEKAWGGQNDLGIGILQYDEEQYTNKNGETTISTYEENAVFGYICYSTEDELIEEGQTNRYIYKRMG